MWFQSHLSMYRVFTASILRPWGAGRAANTKGEVSRCGFVILLPQQCLYGAKYKYMVYYTMILISDQIYSIPKNTSLSTFLLGHVCFPPNTLGIHFVYKGLCYFDIGYMLRASGFTIVTWAGSQAGNADGLCTNTIGDNDVFEDIILYIMQD